jgi:DNA-directed RNA polymerase II subunit RPB1
MTQRGIFTSITRHGINRVNSGPLRKCSFEETAEILLEAAFYGEHDTLTGITENIIFGQLAPYGTGSVDLIVDKEALLNCNQMPNEDIFDGQVSLHSDFLSSSEPTPKLGKTPHIGMGQTVGGASVYSQNPEAGFTPNIY